MTTVAIHQPNYLPWLGYFRKIALADVFVFLDDVQYSKNSYTNRVRILAHGAPRWLTVPVSFRFGDAINAVRPSDPAWPGRHLDTLKGFYGTAPAFREVWPDIEAIYRAVPHGDLAAVNRHIVERTAEALALQCRFVAASDIDVGGRAGDERLAALARALAPEGTYLSGAGGSKYQSEETFRASGIELRYAEFAHPVYGQDGDAFVAGLSVVDAVFRLGWKGAAALLDGSEAT